MASGFLVRKNQYYDSVFLMGVNKRLSQHPGVQQTAALMATENNKRLLADIGIHGDEIDIAKPNDLVVAVIAESPQIVEVVLESLDEALLALEGSIPISQFRTFEEGLADKPLANLAVLSIPGEFVYREAIKALDAGLNVFIFSSNVDVEEELRLKQSAVKKNSLVMGPDCGTSLLGGVGLGFSNVVRRGPIGAIGPSGTGLQEFTSQVHNEGYGISHAIGTGSRDLSDEIGGITTFAALEALEDDEQTSIISVVTKPPGERTFGQLLTRLKTCKKPVVGCFLGAGMESLVGGDSLVLVPSIDEAVHAAIHRLNAKHAPAQLHLTQQERDLAARTRENWHPEQRYLRGLFAGGTFCYQSQQILKDAGVDVYSNAPLDHQYRLTDPDQSHAHSFIDLGDETYTLGRPHPMIDGTIRKQRILTESRDPTVAILLLDFILGYNAAMDPAGELQDAIVRAMRDARKRGGELTVVASICGTEEDPQDLNLQARLLREAGVIVFQSNARAALFCSELVKPG
ncbi:MAG: acyl-CoA synthetase FdrA [Anaerolineales bacterium]|nr:acyl-CoA synthetase FdrA [Anaerolineales bacterium]